MVAFSLVENIKSTLSISNNDHHRIKYCNNKNNKKLGIEYHNIKKDNYKNYVITKNSTMEYKDNKSTIRWTEHEEDTLRLAVQIHSKNWHKVCEYLRLNNNLYSVNGFLELINNKECEKHWQRMCERGIKGPWTKSEDALLWDLVKRNGAKQWSTIAFFMGGRSGKQCRERWVNHLSPDICKNPWTEKEIERMRELYRIHGSHWTMISKEMEGRPENAIKNKWNSLNRRKSRSIGSSSNTSIYSSQSSFVSSDEENQKIENIDLSTLTETFDQSIRSPNSKMTKLMEKTNSKSKIRSKSIKSKKYQNCFDDKENIEIKLVSDDISKNEMYYKSKENIIKKNIDKNITDKRCHKRKYKKSQLYNNKNLDDYMFDHYKPHKILEETTTKKRKMNISNGSLPSLHYHSKNNNYNNCFPCTNPLSLSPTAATQFVFSNYYLNKNNNVKLVDDDDKKWITGLNEEDQKSACKRHKYVVLGCNECLEANWIF